MRQVSRTSDIRYANLHPIAVQCSSRAGFLVIGLHIPRQAKQAQDHNSVPVGIDLVPFQAMPRRLRVCVVVVVPSLTERQQSYPETVPGIIVRIEALIRVWLWQQAVFALSSRGWT